MKQIWRQAYKYRLRATKEQQRKLRQFCGCARYVWNQILAKRQEEYQEYLEDIDSAQSFGEDISLVAKPKKINQFSFNYDLKRLKEDKENSFLLTQCHSQVLQQKIQDLYISYKKFFNHEAGYPKFKSKGRGDTIRFPQGIKLEEKQQRIYLPKIGFIRYRKSRDIEGKIKNVTVSCVNDSWYVSIQTEREIDIPKIDLKTAIENKDNKALGIDMGAVRFCTFSNGRYEDTIKSLTVTELDKQIAVLQKKLKNKEKGSKRRLKNIKRISKLHQRKANIRNDHLHKLSTEISKNHVIVCVEDLKIVNMTKSAKGTKINPGYNVKAKSGLNRSILAEGWGIFFKQLEYKQKKRGQIFLKINPKNTSRKCPKCGHISKDNRLSQAKFLCTNCGYTANADENAAGNILRASLARLAQEVNFQKSQHCEPTEAR